MVIIIHGLKGTKTIKKIIDYIYFYYTKQTKEICALNFQNTNFYTMFFLWLEKS